MSTRRTLMTFMLAGLAVVLSSCRKASRREPWIRSVPRT